MVTSFLITINIYYEKSFGWISNSK